MPRVPCCSGCSDEPEREDPYAQFSDTKLFIESVSERAKTHRQQLALEAAKARDRVDSGSNPDDDTTAGPQTSLQRLQRNNPFQGVPMCPAMLFSQGQEAKICLFCGEAFGVSRRRHHCRLCGHVFHGGRCSRKERLTASQAEPVTVCALCYGFYTHYRQSMQRGRKFTEYGRNRSCIHRSMVLSSECDALHLGQPIRIAGRSSERHLRDTASITDIQLVDVAEVSLGYPSGALMGLSEGADAPVIKLATTSRSLLLGLESREDQKLWLEGVRAAVHVTKRAVFIAEASGESWRQENQSIMTRRSKERARRMLGYSLAKDKWSEPIASPPPASSRMPKQPQQQQSQSARRTSGSTPEGGQQQPHHHQHQRQQHGSSTTAAVSYDRTSVSSDTDSVPSVPQNSATNSGCPSPLPARRTAAYPPPSANNSSNGNNNNNSSRSSSSRPVHTDLAQAVVEMEMSDVAANGQKQKWTVRATSSMPQSPPRKVNSPAADSEHHHHQQQQQQHQQQMHATRVSPRDYTPSPSHMHIGGLDSDDGAAATAGGDDIGGGDRAASAAAGALWPTDGRRPQRPPRRKPGPPRPPPPAIVRASPPVPIDETLDESAYISKLAADIPVAPLQRDSAQQRSSGRRQRSPVTKDSSSAILSPTDAPAAMGPTGPTSLIRAAQLRLSGRRSPKPAAPARGASPAAAASATGASPAAAAAAASVTGYRNSPQRGEAATAGTPTSPLAYPQPVACIPSDDYVHAAAQTARPLELAASPLHQANAAAAAAAPSDEMEYATEDD